MVIEILTPGIESQSLIPIAEVTRPQVPLVDSMKTITLDRSANDIVTRVSQVTSIGIGTISKGPERLLRYGKGRSPRGMCSECHTVYRIREGHRQCISGKRPESKPTIGSFSLKIFSKQAA